MKRFFLYFIFGIPWVALSQNLVNNGGFENTDVPVNTNTNKFNNEHVSGVEIAPGWYTVTPATPDYFTGEFASDTTTNTIVLPLNGKGRIGIIGGSCRILFGSNQYKEYVEGSLKEPLIKDQFYQVSFYIAHDPRSTVAIDNFGVLFSDTLHFSEEQKRLPQKPNLIMHAGKPVLSEYGWVNMTGTYKAKGGEKFIIIGSFSEKSCIPLNSLDKTALQKKGDQRIVYNAYYFLDEVSVKLTHSNNDSASFFPLKNKEPKADKFLFVIDISKSMGDDNKLLNLKNAVLEIADQLPEDSKIAIVAYQARSKLVLPFTVANNTKVLNSSLDSLTAGGGTDFSSAMRFSYDYLIKTREPNENELIIVFTDGVFAVESSIQKLVKNTNTDYGTGFSVMQFGETKNGDLLRLAIATKGDYMENANVDLKSKLNSVLIQNRNNSQKFYPIYLSGEEPLVKFTSENKISDNEHNKSDHKNKKGFVFISVVLAGLITTAFFIFR